MIDLHFNRIIPWRGHHIYNSLYMWVNLSNSVNLTFVNKSFISAANHNDHQLLPLWPTNSDKVTLPSRLRIRNSDPGGLRSSSLVLGNWGSPHHAWVGKELFLNWMPERSSNPRSPIFQADSFIMHQGPRPGHDRVWLLTLWFWSDHQVAIITVCRNSHQNHSFLMRPTISRPDLLINFNRKNYCILFIPRSVLLPHNEFKLMEFTRNMTVRYMRLWIK